MVFLCVRSLLSLRLLTVRPVLCDVQVLYKGYAATSGAPYLSHVLTDRFVSPPDLATRQFVERLFVLPQSMFANSHRYAFPETPLSVASEADAAVQGLPMPALLSGPLLCVFNSLYKVDRETFAVWMDLMRAFPQTYECTAVVCG